MKRAIEIINGKIEQEKMVMDWLHLIPTMTQEKHEQIIKTTAKIEALNELIEEIDILDKIKAYEREDVVGV